MSLNNTNPGEGFAVEINEGGDTVVSSCCLCKKPLMLATDNIGNGHRLNYCVENADCAWHQYQAELARWYGCQMKVLIKEYLEHFPCCDKQHVLQLNVTGAYECPHCHAQYIASGFSGPVFSSKDINYTIRAIDLLDLNSMAVAPALRLVKPGKGRFVYKKELYKAIKRFNRLKIAPPVVPDFWPDHADIVAALLSRLERLGVKPR